MMSKPSSLALALLVLAACGDDDKPETAERDAAVPDAATGDARTAQPDAGRQDGATVDSAIPDSAAPDSATPATCDDAPTLPALRLEAVPGVGSLNRLVFAAQAPGSSDWYLVQQSGTIRVLSNGALKPGNFLDVSSQIKLKDDGDERGLLGLAFAPDYATSGKFYVMMTPTEAPNANRDSLLEYTQSGGTVSPTPKEILRLPASEENHNGGNMTFGKDGLMYVGTGDGGGGCNNNSESGGSQDPKSLFGKILRLDLSKQADNYAAAGNPFDGSNGDKRVLHYGLRNPFRFGLDRTTGDLFIGDVGQDKYEEVDYAPAAAKGLNFGWPVYEGSVMNTCGAKQLNPGSMATPPIVSIDRTMGDYADYKSVIGSAPYRGTAIPSLAGVLLFGDYVGARYQALEQCGSKTSPVTQLLREKNANTPNVPGFTRADGVQAISSLVAIVQGNDNELYLVSNRNTLVKVVPGS